jgi:hypothetical protein
MLLLLWRFPMPTSIASIVSLGFLLHCVHFARWVDLAGACRTETSEFAGPPLPAAGGGISSEYRRTSTQPPLNPLVKNDIRKTRQGGRFYGSVETPLLLPSRIRSIAALTEHSAENDVPNLVDNNSAFCALTDFRREYPTTVNADVARARQWVPQHEHDRSGHRSQSFSELGAVACNCGGHALAGHR